MLENLGTLAYFAYTLKAILSLCLVLQHFAQYSYIYLKHW